MKRRDKLRGEMTRRENDGEEGERDERETK